MKAQIKSLLIVVILIIGSSIHLSAQSTKLTGDWEDKATWEGNVQVPIIIKNNHSYASINILENHQVHIGETNNLKDLVIENNGLVLNIYGELTINGNLDAKNSLTINIAPYAKLTINGSVTVDNGLIINVSENGTFIINGTVNMKNDATIDVDGDLVADAIVGKQNNTITGDGSLYVDTITGVETGIFSGTIVGDNTNLYFASPENLSATVSGDLKVSLTWDFTDVAVSGYEFFGFQIFRNLGGNLHYDEIILGEIDATETNITGYTATSYNDPYEYEPGATPKYYTRAVYKAVTKAENYAFSPVSNNVDFSEEPLPIELMFFTAESLDGKVNVQWATAAEINNDFFTIEKSIDGSSWEVVDYIAGAGNSNYTIEYSYTDANASEGISYYRLKQTDYDGKFEYFAPVAVNITKAQAVAEILNVKISATSMDVYFQNESENAIIMVADIQGRILAQYNLGSEDYVQNVTVNFPRSYAGEVVMVRMVSNESSVEKKFMIR